MNTLLYNYQKNIIVFKHNFSFKKMNQNLTLNKKKKQNN